MNRRRLLVVGALGLAAAGLIALLLAPRLQGQDAISGYVEGEPLYLAAPVAGRVEAVLVARGQQVSAGQKLFVIDPAQLAAQRDQAAADMAQAQAQAQDARKGQRPVELAVYDANIAAAQARVQDAAADLRRVRPLVQRGFHAPARLDEAQAAFDAAAAQAAAARRQRDAATLGARDDLIRAADSRVAQAAAGLAGAQAKLSDLAPVAPRAARVEDTFYQPGEWAPANAPILSLLPHDRITVRFFVPERQVSAYRPGARVAFSCDGCAPGLSATVTYVSPRPEFTPPVIYSRQNRDRLVFLVEARPTAQLNPGQPVDVVPLGAGR